MSGTLGYMPLSFKNAFVVQEKSSLPQSEPVSVPHTGVPEAASEEDAPAAAALGKPKRPPRMWERTSRRSEGWVALLSCIA